MQFKTCSFFPYPKRMLLYLYIRHMCRDGAHLAVYFDIEV